MRHSTSLAAFLVRAGFARPSPPRAVANYPGVTITIRLLPAALKTSPSSIPAEAVDREQLRPLFPNLRHEGATASVSLFPQRAQDFFGSVRTADTPQLLAEFGLAEGYEATMS